MCIQLRSSTVIKQPRDAHVNALEEGHTNSTTILQSLKESNAHTKAEMDKLAEMDDLNAKFDVMVDEKKKKDEPLLLSINTILK